MNIDQPALRSVINCSERSLVKKRAGTKAVRPYLALDSQDKARLNDAMSALGIWIWCTKEDRRAMFHVSASVRKWLKDPCPSLA
jgi:hypothetical protein